MLILSAPYRSSFIHIPQCNKFHLTFIAEPYTAPVSGTPGERTLKNYLQTAMNPVGTALYAVSDIMECPIEETFKKGWPFYLAIVGVILFMIFFPQAVLFLPNLVYGA